MADSPSFSSSSSSKLVYFVVIPLILLSGLLLAFNQKTSRSLSWPEPRRKGNSNPTPATAAGGGGGGKEDHSPISKNTRLFQREENLDTVEASLARARAAIHLARQNNESSYDPDYIPTGSFYRNAVAFHRSYLEMEKLFKLYVYEEGEPPLFHYSNSLGILGIEGILMHQIEISKFRTTDPRKAHVYFLPLSVQSIASYAYVIHNREWTPLQDIARDYIKLISTKYPYWNRTSGHDHFLLACHDWAPTISHGVPQMFKNTIRVLCNANTSEGFKPSTDVSMPEIYLPDGTMDGLIGGPPASKRSILVFYAGGVHGDIRQVLMEHWKDNDPDVQVHDYLPKDMSYYDMFRKSKFCICPSGWEVASPRMVEALYTGCVPVLLKDNYAKPFDDVLDWTTFAVDVRSKEIPDLKNILTAIPADKYGAMQETGTIVRRHFEVNFPPKRYDVFHMILHSIWLRRINIQLHDTE
ncbi:probable glycosyltransferase At5g03795 [Andrographis paniculata]|uniref:probable glycosyltransferase At5g03795 n=1 Tax=Andrographis paniculata TaxID=175694 RepID=UPI0021E94800|nr:probable glycosyltransferase At5g03795 [Andrographis paniculata]